MNPIWLIVWMSSVVAGLPEQKINGYKMFTSSPAAISYVYDTIPDMGQLLIFNGQEYKLKSELRMILEKKTTVIPK